MKLSMLEVHKKIQKRDKSAKMSTNQKASFLSRIQTVSGKRLCSDPNSGWTKRAMRKVDEAKMNNFHSTEM
uniref:Chemokine interleukin-8-like domain-containing protein n=1 Tax=Sinocyclocheilus grahami TaxID=75366 RepID=A0A672SG63_SINGR